MKLQSHAESLGSLLRTEDILDHGLPLDPATGEDVGWKIIESRGKKGVVSGSSPGEDGIFDGQERFLAGCLWWSRTSSVMLSGRQTVSREGTTARDQTLTCIPPGATEPHP